MKIALVILHADRNRGGAEKYTLDLAIALRKRGHDVKLLATTFSADVLPEQRIKLADHGFTRSASYVSFLDDLDEHIAANQYDIVHAMLPVRKCHLYHPHAGVAALVSRGSLSDLMNPRRFKYADVERDLVTQKTSLAKDRKLVILSLSSYIDAQFADAYSNITLPLERLMNAVDLNRFTLKPQTQNSVTQALIVAQDFERKGVGQAIMALVKVPDTHLTIVGKDNPARFKATCD